jgi:hypothetical protein
MGKKLHPVYVQGLTTRNRLTDACTAVYRLIRVLSGKQRSTAIVIYNDLCSIQGRLEDLLVDVPNTENESDDVGPDLIVKQGE